jgi:predicted DNA-binding transcriptional regulator YafY
MNRLDRLSAILIQLQSRKTLRAQDIADRFEISLRTVYRDIRSLEEAGVPIIGEAGIGYSLMDGYRLPPVMFTREEATAFLTAEKLVSQLTDSANGNLFSSALDKVRAVLKSGEKDYLENIDGRIEVLKSSRLPKPQEHHNPLQTILKAVAEKFVMKLKYFAYYRQEHTSRFIEPIGVFYLEGHWHLIAYCRERKECRDFRFDRITEIVLTDEIYVDVHCSLKEYLADLYKDIKLIEITVMVDKNAHLHLGEQKYYMGFVSETDHPDGIEMQFLSMSLEGFARWYMSFADYAQIIKPQQLLNRVKEIHATTAKKLKDSKNC